MRRKILLLLAFSFCICLIALGQTQVITGKIKDDKGMPLVGASVVIKGTKTNTQTNASGLFKIVLDSTKSVLNAKLIISFVGYETKEVKIGNKNRIDIVMRPASNEMSEVVVVGYGTQRRTSITGSVTSIQGKSLGATYGNGYYKSDFNTEEYDHIAENNFHKVTDDPLSTFSIDVDAASYSNVRRFLNSNQLPPADAVRVEEMINYFHYDYPQPLKEDQFSINTEISSCPWNANHKLVMIGLQGKKIPAENLPACNLVFLIDVSGSMQDPNKLPLVQSSLKLLTDQLREQDKISIVVYAGNAGLVLPATSGSNKIKIKEAIDQLEAGGSTAGGAGIQLAYKTAKQNFIRNGNNRIILCTDGDFNVGVSSNGELERMVEKERESGVFLTVLGYGMGNYKDSKMQILADKGNGNHAYIDGEGEAKKVLVNEFGGTMFTIAKDVKLQIEFNPSRVQGYRLIGYENRLLNKEDFNDDKKDAGELGSGHTVTALYEIIPVGVDDEFLKTVDDLKYQKKAKSSKASGSDEMLTVKFRYKEPSGSESKLIEHRVIDKQIAFDHTSENFRFAASVAEFGMLLTDSKFKSNASFGHVIQTAKNARGRDAEGYRKEFITLVRKADNLKGNEEDEQDDVTIR
ncbi:MAG TPA: von Willebrand factor type A domain-containing protein [Flavisolibacter sp.]|jgi:Ca-activated chloride channel family protein|nr:von Willebrand factor type A domain-containing protein [Flavisolibacter sp.]